LIIVLGSRYDTTAQRLVERWAAYGACLLTCADLSVAGWVYHLADRSIATAVIGGRKVVLEEIRGVVTRLPWVTEHELVSIASADRAYVAAEMSAFLAFWLSELNCPVLNRPTPGSLNGPSWRREQWIFTAARVGMRVASVRHHFSLSSTATLHDQVAASTTVTVVGDRCLGQADASLLERSRQLAEAANVELLGIQFSDGSPEATFLNATLYPGFDSIEVTDAMLRYFEPT
jgi:hypothetical protein